MRLGGMGDTIVLCNVCNYFIFFGIYNGKKLSIVADFELSLAY